jgi:excisionase family DNA binding protein
MKCNKVKPKTPGLVGPGEVAEWLNVSRNSVLNWAKDGKIPAIIVGRVYRFDPLAVAEELKLPPWIVN